MLCGDFWEDHLLSQIINLDNAVDAFLWPVHCDFSIEEWNNFEKVDYTKRSEILSKPILFCNNYCEEDDLAKGGAFVWHQGKTLQELPLGQKGILITEI